MYKNIPGKASLSTTSFGVSRREVFLLGAAVFIGLALLAVPYTAIFGRVVVSFLFMGGTAVYTFWRVDGQWPIEVYLFNRLKYQARNRAFVRGGQRIVSGQEKVDSIAAGRSKIPEAYHPAGGVLLELPGFSNGQLFFSVAGVVILAIFLAWVGTGGVADAQVQLRMLFEDGL